MQFCSSLNANIYLNHTCIEQGPGQTSWPLAYSALQDNSAFETNTFTLPEQADRPASQGKLQSACILHTSKHQDTVSLMISLTITNSLDAVHMWEDESNYPHGHGEQQLFSAMG